MCCRKPVETNQMTLLHGWPIWAGCALVLHWWKSFVGTLVHISPVHTKVVKLTSRHHPMTFCMHFGRLNPWRSETPLSKRWQLRREQQFNESLRPWSVMTDDTRLESPEKKASWSWPVIMKYNLTNLRVKRSPLGEKAQRWWRPTLRSLRLWEKELHTEGTQVRNWGAVVSVTLSSDQRR